ncbi:hypothetical protein R1flu_015636 [Riccia fluitans]|uniref:Protein kinase domain-containing protein n=1 Tax=Riccia fluitans TaxID=41844 RepID=A0ABD1YJU6_9MARC
MIDTSETLSAKYPTLRKLAAIARVQCVSTAQCERAFSIQNHIKDKYRNTLIVARLDALIPIDLEGPELEDLPEFDYLLITQGYDDHCHEKTLEPLSRMPKTKLPVAVKRVSNDSKQGKREFVAEVSIISHLQHRNIVRLLGWCDDRDKLLLVYELMPNGSLDKALFHKEEMVLSWEYRFRIIKGLAAALQYLHEGWRQQIIHRDIKSSNVMLDKDYNAMLGDFGLARMVDRHQNPATTMVVGTFGYIAPEVPVTRRFMARTDVYTFGAMALEIFYGRVAFDQWLAADETVLMNWVWSKLDKDKLLSVVDPRLEDQFDKKEAELLLCLGLLYSNPNPNDQPSMRQVVDILEEVVPMLVVPRSKPAFPYHQVAPHYRMEDLVKSSPNLSSVSSRFEDNHLFSTHANSFLSTPDETEPLLPRSDTPLGISGNVTLVRLIRNFFQH